ncbi:MAG: beta-glucosidase [Acidobacteriaceae bacterium]|nr:beta-glucosidase [Acidobacteriaceae bacterium]MBV9500612.1 beta-glucosidase [Acidobacteriaceae bacterium]
MQNECGLRSFFLGGFECSSHRRRDGKRLDLIAATQHDRFCEADYARLHEIGVSSVRDGIRWHLIETCPHRYDFSSLLPMLKAARKTSMQVIWDLFHYGWPDDLDIFSSEFLGRFAAFAREVAHVMHNESDNVPYFCPVNEISFFAWGAGDFGVLNPFARGRGQELKAQLVRAAMVAIDSIRSVAPRARFVQVDPVINVVGAPDASEAEQNAAAAHTRAQFDAWDMLSGRLWADLGGMPEYLDIVGVNYYVHNQWVYGGKFIEASDPRYKPFHQILSAVYSRYSRPVFIAETGIEDERRPEWLRYICDEVVEAIQRGIPVEGICLYPILNYPGWDDERHCHAGLWDSCNGSGDRDIYRPLAEEINRQRQRIQPLLLPSAVA